MNTTDRLNALGAAVDQLRVALEGDALVAAVCRESGLDPRATAPALNAWAEQLDRAAWERLLATAQRPVGGRVTTIAPGNVPVVAAECIILGVLAGVEHTVALSRRATAIAHALMAALADLSPALASQTRLVAWRGLSSDHQSELLSDRRVVVYGSADTVDWFATRASQRSLIVPHGPSVSLGLVASRGRDWRPALARLARDVCTFDQRGCRSPHALIAIGPPDEFATLPTILLDELVKLGRTEPRGRLTDPEAVAVYLDGLTSSALGRTLAGPDCRVTVETGAVILRPSPGGRTIRVLFAPDKAAAARLVGSLPAPWGLGLTANGRAIDVGGPAPLEWAPMGEAQRPPFDRLHDGRHRLDELLCSGQ